MYYIYNLKHVSLPVSIQVAVLQIQIRWRDGECYTRVRARKYQKESVRSRSRDQYLVIEIPKPPLSLCLFHQAHHHGAPPRSHETLSQPILYLLLNHHHDYVCALQSSPPEPCTIHLPPCCCAHAGHVGECGIETRAGVLRCRSPEDQRRDRRGAQGVCLCTIPSFSVLTAHH